MSITVECRIWLKSWIVHCLRFKYTRVYVQTFKDWPFSLSRNVTEKDFVLNSMISRGMKSTIIADIGQKPLV